MNGAFSLENMAQAAVSGVRDAASIVKGFQDDEDNIKRMDEFIGVPGASQQTSGKKKLAGAFGKGKLKLGGKFGRALGKIKKAETIEEKKKERTRKGSTYKFGDGDGHYWDRWLTPARSAKCALPETGWASRSYVEPLGGYKKTNAQKKLVGKTKRAAELEVENKMLDDHIEYAQKNMGHVVNHHIGARATPDNSPNISEEKLLSAFGTSNLPGTTSASSSINNISSSSSSNDTGRNRGRDGSITTSPRITSTVGRQSLTVPDAKFYENYRLYESKINHEAKLFKYKEKHKMTRTSSSHSMHAMDPDSNPDHHLTASMLSFQEESLGMNVDVTNHSKYGQLPPMVRTAKPIVQVPDDCDWMIKMYKSTANPVITGLLGTEIRTDLVPEPLISRALSSQKKKMSQILSENEVDFEHFGLGDTRGVRLAQSLRSLRHMKTLNLNSNRLTQTSIVSLIEALIDMGKEGKTQLESLSIADNNLGLAGAKAMHHMLTTIPPINLISLNLSHVGLTDKQCEELVQGLIEVGQGSGSHSLQTIDLSHNRISSRGGVAFGDLLALEGSQCQITELDLSWNVLSGKGAVRLGEALAGEDTLKKLNLAYNSFGKSGALSMGKALETNETLSYLDLTSNSVGWQSCMVIAYGLSINEALETLILDLNPIGESGARAMLRLYAEGEEDTTLYASQCNFTLDRQHSKVQDPDLEDPLCISITKELAQNRINLSQEGVEEIDQHMGEPGSPRGTEQDPTNTTLSSVVKSAIDFEPGNPTGTYILDLDKPFERSIAYLILELANKFPGFELGDSILHKEESGVSITFGISREPNENLSEERAKVIDASTGDLWEVPERGLLTMVVTKHWYMPYPCVGIEEAALERMIIVMYGRPDATEEERTKMLQMACMDMYFTANQAAKIMSNIHAFEERAHAAALLMPRLLDDDKVFRDVLSPAVLSQVEKYMGQLFHFYPQNPTGHYILNLSRESDRVIMTKLMEINAVDKRYAKHESKHGDTSMHGDWSNFRNGLYKDHSVNLEIVFRNGIPERGNVIVDYVSPRRCSRDSVIMTEKELDTMVSTLNFMEEFDNEILLTKFLVPYPKPKPKLSKKKRGWGKVKNKGTMSMLSMAKTTSPPKEKNPTKEESPEKDAEGGKLSMAEILKRDDPEELKKLTFEYKLNERCSRLRDLFKSPMSPQLERMIHKMNMLRGYAAENFFTCAQVARMVCTIPIQFPSCRVAAVQILFNRIVNFEYFFEIEDAMNSTKEDEFKLQSEMLQERIGLLNYLNPNYVDREYMLRTNVYEDNKIARLLVDYAIAEPGENWQHVTRQHNLMQPPMPGWDLNAIFYPDTLCKFDGTFVCLTYYSGADESCRPIWSMRKKWMNQFLVADGGEYEWNEFDHTDIPYMHLHYPTGVTINKEIGDYDLVSALRTRNNNLLLARPEFEKRSNTWHVF